MAQHIRELDPLWESELEAEEWNVNRNQAAIKIDPSVLVDTEELGPKLVADSSSEKHELRNNKEECIVRKSSREREKQSGKKEKLKATKETQQHEEVEKRKKKKKKKSKALSGAEKEKEKRRKNHREEHPEGEKPRAKKTEKDKKDSGKREVTEMKIVSTNSPLNARHQHNFAWMPEPRKQHNSNAEAPTAQGHLACQQPPKQGQEIHQSSCKNKDVCSREDPSMRDGEGFVNRSIVKDKSAVVEREQEQELLHLVDLEPASPVSSRKQQHLAPEVLSSPDLAPEPSVPLPIEEDYCSTYQRTRMRSVSELKQKFILPEWPSSTHHENQSFSDETNSSSLPNPSELSNQEPNMVPASTKEERALPVRTTIGAFGAPPQVDTKKGNPAARAVTVKKKIIPQQQSDRNELMHVFENIRRGGSLRGTARRRSSTTAQYQFGEKQNNAILG